MSKSFVPILVLALLTATSAQAQSSGGHGRGGRGGGGSPGSAPSSSSGPAPPADKPANQIEIVGVITAIDPGSDRVTIAYEPVDALNWPSGTMPFVVSKSALLNGATVGEKVRFKVDSHQISDLTRF